MAFKHFLETFTGTYDAEAIKTLLCVIHEFTIGYWDILAHLFILEIFISLKGYVLNYCCVRIFSPLDVISH